jgi:hypothetical protein
LSNLIRRFSEEKSSQKFGLFLQFSKKLPYENNRPLGETSPNLVTLVGITKFTYILTGRQGDQMGL